MSKSNDPVASREGAGSGIGLLNGGHSTSNRRGLQALFLADRGPDRVIGGQPFWILGTCITDTRFDLVVSLCVDCGAPYLSTIDDARERRYFNRRCGEHHKPGRAVRRFTAAWAVKGAAK